MTLRTWGVIVFVVALNGALAFEAFPWRGLFVGIVSFGVIMIVESKKK